MADHPVDDKAAWAGAWRRMGLAFAGMAAFLVIAVLLETIVGIGFDTTYRVGCAGMCLLLIWRLESDYPGERWPRTGLWLALFVNVAIFFTPLVSRPASRGELMLFLLPDAIVVLSARLATYPVVDVHGRAMRQQMILGLVVAVVACAGLYAALLLDPHTGR